ncbi:hypothetical protein RQM59_02670 [Flavobacteriaceae bacterium S356]|uniref:Protein BatD n=1 Tax=Asprobacillus argus TaxID=3076534 RepID=A0ABU3LDH9_9FLAO|nr:hypothetical protein [Flavobacteriaceae bacterium S356]
MKKLVLYVLMISSSFVFAQSTPRVTAKVDTTSIRIGEQFELKIEVNDTTNVIIPKLDKLVGLEIVEDDKIDTIKSRLLKRYVLTGFDSGAYYIPQQQIFIRNQAFLTDSILINVATVPIDTTKQKMFPIKSIQEEPYVFDDFKPYLIWVILGLLLIGLLLYFILKKKKIEEQEEIIPLLPPYEEALEKLKVLDHKLLWQNNKIKQYYSELTEIIREYIEKELKVPALEITSDELINYIKDFKDAETLDLSKETFEKLKGLLQEADLVKFAKSKPLSHEIEEDRKDAEDILNSMKPKPVIEEEDDELE